MKTITIKIPAKVNFTLDVLGKAGGYHEIESLVASIDLFDAVTVSAAEEISFAETGILCDCPAEQNNAVKAARLFFENRKGGAAISVEKHIPLGGGLGGSSADAAGVLLALGRLYGAEPREIERLAERVGSDVKYMLYGGCAVLRGRGEKICKVPCVKKIPLLLLLSSSPVNTGECYRLCDEAGLSPVNGTERAVRSVIKGDIGGLKRSLFNGMEGAARQLNGEIGEHLEALKNAGGAAAMSGSGSAVFAVFCTENARDDAYRKLFPRYRDKLIKCATLV